MDTHVLLFHEQYRLCHCHCDLIETAVAIVVIMKRTIDRNDPVKSKWDWYKGPCEL